MPSFDFRGARAAGYSNKDIVDFLRSKVDIDVDRLRRQGFNDDDIVGYLENTMGVAHKGEEERPGFGTMAGQSFMRGLHQAVATGKGLIGWGAELVGASNVADAMLESARKSEEEASYYKPTFKSYEDIRTDSVGNFAEDVAGYATETLFENLPNLATMIGGAGVATRVLAPGAMALALGKKEASQAARQAAAKKALAAATGGAWATSSGMSIGSIFEDIHEKTGQKAVGVPAMYGIVVGALDAIPMSRLLGSALKHEIATKAAQGLLRRYGTEGIKQFGIEGLTEGLQRIVERAAVAHVDPSHEIFSEEGITEIIDSALRGGVVGGVMGVGGKAVSDVSGRGRGGAISDETAPLQASEVLGAEQPAEDSRARAHKESLPVGAESDAISELPVMADVKAFFEEATRRPDILVTIERVIAEQPDVARDKKADAIVALRELQADPNKIFNYQQYLGPEILKTIEKAQATMDRLARRARPSSAGQAAPSVAEDREEPSAITEERAGQPAQTETTAAPQPATQPAGQIEAQQAQEQQAPQAPEQPRIQESPRESPAAAFDAEERERELRKQREMDALGRMAREHRGEESIAIAEAAGVGLRPDYVSTMEDAFGRARILGKDPRKASDMALRIVARMGTGEARDSAIRELERRAEERRAMSTMEWEGGIPADRAYAKLSVALARSARDQGMVPSRLNPVAEAAAPFRMRMYSRLAEKAFGVRTLFFEGDPDISGEGIVHPEVPRTIFVNVLAKRSPARLIGHELLHSLKQRKPDVYRALIAALNNSVDIDKAKAVYGSLYGDRTESVQIEEMAADIFGDHHADPRFWYEMFKNTRDARALMMAAVTALDAMRMKLRIAFKALRGDTEGARAIRGEETYLTNEIVRDVENVRRAVLQAYEAWQKGEPVAAPRVADREMLSKTGSRDIDELLKRLPKNEKGEFIGAEKWAASDIQDLVDKMERMAAEGVRGKHWYEHSAKTLLRNFGGNKRATFTFMQMLAITSGTRDVKTNFSLAHKALMQFARGQPIAVADRVTNRKLNDLLYFGVPWEGRKTNNFYRDLAEEIGGEKSTETTQDMHMAHLAFGKDSVTDDEYTFMDTVTKWLASELGVRNKQMQAMLWVAQKARSLVKRYRERGFHRNLTDEELRERALNEAAIHYGNLADKKWREAILPTDIFKDPRELRAAARQITAEVKPSTSLDVGKAVAHLSMSKLQQYQKDAFMSVFGPKGPGLLLEALGYNRTQYMIVDGAGGYDGGIAPNVVISLNGSANDALRVAKSWMYVFKQDAVPFFRADPRLARSSGAAQGVVLTTATNLNITALRRLYDALRALVHPGIGVTKTSSRDVAVINFRGDDGKPFLMTDRAFISAIRKAIDGDALGVKIERYGRIGAEGQYPWHDWRGEPGGSGLLDAALAGGSPDLQARLDHWADLFWRFANERAAEYRRGGDEQPKLSRAGERAEARAPPQRRDGGDGVERAGGRRLGRGGSDRLGGVGEKEEVRESKPASPAERRRPETEEKKGEPKKEQAATVDEAAHEAATSPKNELPEPTEAQRQAGNYRKGHVVIAGLDISIENPAGSRRRPEWPELTAHYGYIRLTEDKTGEQIDVFVKPGTESDWNGPVAVVDTNDLRSGKHDEYKVMLGWSDPKEALRAIRANYSADVRDSLVRSVRVFDSVEDFKRWLKDGDTKAPAADQEQKEEERLAKNELELRQSLAAERAAIWYSALEREVEKKNPGNASVGLWKSYIDGLVSRGVKKDEIEWSGVKEWLDLQSGKVSPDDVLTYLRARGVRLTETWYGVHGGEDVITLVSTERVSSVTTVHRYETGDGKHRIIIWSENLRKHTRLPRGKWWRWMVDNDPNRTGYAWSAANALLEARDKWLTGYVIDGNSTRDDTKYRDYKLPGGFAYGELLLRLPHYRDAQLIGVEERLARAKKGTSEHEELTSLRNGLLRRFVSSPHWRERNIIAHVRFDTRRAEQGKSVLFLEELQSDWAQRGRETGFRSAAHDEELAVLRRKWRGALADLRALGLEPDMGKLSRINDAKAESFTPLYIAENEDGTFDVRIVDSDVTVRTVARKDEVGDWANILNDKELATYRAFLKARDEYVSRDAAIGGLALQGPFVRSTEAWVGLLLKRMIRYAAERNMDAIAWTTGEQQAARYDLSAHIDHITYVKRRDNRVVLHVYRKEDGANISQRLGLPEEMEMAEVEKYVGREIAQKIRDGGDRGELVGLNLKMGGEGMRTFYDRIVPGVANELLKKLGGGRVRTIRIEGIDSDGQLGFDITPRLQESVLGGMPLFSRRGARVPRIVWGARPSDGTWVSLTADGRYQIEPDVVGYWAVVDGRYLKWFQTRGLAAEALNRVLREEVRAGTVTNWFVANSLVREYPEDGVQRVVDGWRKLATAPEFFRVPRSSKTDLVELLNEVMPRGMHPAVSVRDIGAWKSYTITLTRNGDERYVYITHNTTTREAYFDTADLEGGSRVGSLIYPALYNWAHNNRITIIPDPAGISTINMYRRTEQMFNAALKFGTTRTVVPHHDQGLEGWIENPRTREEEDHNLALMALRSMRNVLNNVPEARTLTYNFGDGKIEDEHGNHVTFEKLRYMAAGYDARIRGIGPTTIARAVFTRSLLRNSGGVNRFLAGEIQPSKMLSERHGDLEQPLSFYSLAKPRVSAGKRAAVSVAKAALMAARPIGMTFDVVNKSADFVLAPIGKLLIRPITSRLHDRWLPAVGRAITKTKVGQKIAHGMAADYGLPEPYLVMRDDREIEIQKSLRKSKDLLDQIAGLSRTQLRIAYQWMQEKPNEGEEQRLRAMLPDEELKHLDAMRKMIADYGGEAVRFDLMSNETYERNKMAYLARSYEVHVLKDPEAVARMAIGKTIIGERFRGRGLRDNVSPTRLPGAQIGDKFVRLELRDKNPDGGLGKLRRVVYLRAGTPIPSMYDGWRNDGVWEVRWQEKDGTLGLWRDLTKEEREHLGEIEEVRFAFAKTMIGLIHDVETARFLKNVADSYAVDTPEQVASRNGTIADAVDSAFTLKVYGDNEWVRVPETMAKGTKLRKYGALAGKYLPGHIWNDIRTTINAQSSSEVWKLYDELVRAWKISKTALSPGVHTNNTMSNFIFADIADVTHRDLYNALMLILRAQEGDEEARAILGRYMDSGAELGSPVLQELKKEIIKPLLDEIRSHDNEIAGQLSLIQGIGLAVRGNFRHAIASIMHSRTATLAAKPFKVMLDAYQMEDTVFRFAKWLHEVERGKTDREAGKLAREAFLDYRINAPWVQVLRRGPLPFFAFAYRAVPRMAESIAHKPWKLMKWAIAGHLMGNLAYAMLGLSGSDEERERRLLPDEKSGYTILGVPRLMRMPMNDKYGNPMFLDIRRWIPAGDIYDVSGSHSAIPLPSWLSVSGLIGLMFELVMNKSQFTGKPIWKESDTMGERVAKVIDHVFKFMTPNLPIPNPVGYALDAAVAESGLLQTYSWKTIQDAAIGKTDDFGRERSVPQAIASSFGVKVASYPADQMRKNLKARMDAEMRDLGETTSKYRREYIRGGLTEEKFREMMQKQRTKREEIRRQYIERIGLEPM